MFDFRVFSWCFVVGLSSDYISPVSICLCAASSILLRHLAWGTPFMDKGASRSCMWFTHRFLLSAMVLETLHYCSFELLLHLCASSAVAVPILITRGQCAPIITSQAILGVSTMTACNSLHSCCAHPPKVLQPAIISLSTGRNTGAQVLSAIASQMQARDLKDELRLACIVGSTSTQSLC